jgi:hypothetical protein
MTESVMDNDFNLDSDADFSAVLEPHSTGDDDDTEIPRGSSSGSDSDSDSDSDGTSPTDYSKDESDSGSSERSEDKEPVRKHKALCYEDIILWVAKDPNNGERDVLAMEVLFRHHKGVDKKPKS